MGWIRVGGRPDGVFDGVFFRVRFSVESLKMEILTIKRGVLKNRNKGRPPKDYGFSSVEVSWQEQSSGKAIEVVKEIIYKSHRLETIKNYKMINVCLLNFKSIKFSITFQFMRPIFLQIRQILQIYSHIFIKNERIYII